MFSSQKYKDLLTLSIFSTFSIFLDRSWEITGSQRPWFSLHRKIFLPKLLSNMENNPTLRQIFHWQVKRNASTFSKIDIICFNQITFKLNSRKFFSDVMTAQFNIFSYVLIFDDVSFPHNGLSGPSLQMNLRPWTTVLNILASLCNGYKKWKVKSDIIKNKIKFHEDKNQDAKQLKKGFSTLEGKGKSRHIVDWNCIIQCY